MLRMEDETNIKKSGILVTFWSCHIISGISKSKPYLFKPRIIDSRYIIICIVLKNKQTTYCQIDTILFFNCTNTEVTLISKMFLKKFLESKYKKITRVFLF